MSIAKKVLVTGGAGFIGSHLCDRLVDAGHDVICLDNYYTGTKANVKSIMQSPNFELLRHDITFPLYVQVDEIFNLACPASPVHYQLDPVQTTKTSVHGAINMLGLSKRIGAKILQASTSEVYGTARFVPINEDHPLQGQSPYSASKIGADQIAMSFYNSFDTPVSIIRPFNTYGPRQSSRAVIPTVITQIANGQQQIRLGALHTTRDFNYIEDMVSGFVAALESYQAIGEVINLGSDFEISIGDTVKTIADVMGKEIEIQTEEQRLRPEKSEVYRLLCDNSLLYEITKWKPDISFNESMKETIDWFSENLNYYKISYQLPLCKFQYHYFDPTGKNLN